MLFQALRFVIEILQTVTLELNKLENKLKQSKSKFKRDYAGYIIDLLALVLISYVYGGLANIFISSLPSLYSIISLLIKPIGFIFTGDMQFLNVSPVVLPSIYINIRGVFFSLILILVIYCIIIYLNKDNDEFRMLKVLSASNSIAYLIFRDLQLRKSLVIIGGLFTFMALWLTYKIGPEDFVSAHLLEISFFWLAIFLILITYSTFNKEEIRAKRFIFFMLFIPIAISNIIQNKLQDPMSLLFFAMTIFLTFERILSILVEYKEQVYEGKEIHFALNYLEEKEFDKIKWKYNLEQDECLELFEDKTLSGLVFYKGTKKNLLKAKICFEQSLIEKPDEVNTQFLLIEVLMDIDKENYNQECLDLLYKMKKQHEKNPDILREIGKYIKELDTKSL